MGNDMVGQVIDAFKKFRPNKVVAKIWNLNKAYVILGVRDLKQWQYEMDPYYTYIDGKVAGISYMENESLMKKMLKPENLIYVNKTIEQGE